MMQRSIPHMYEQNSKLLIHELFNTTTDFCNLPELDGVACLVCNKIPVIKTLQKVNKEGRVSLFVDRSERVDCDAGEKGLSGKLVTYHRECWMQELRKEL